MLSRSSAEAEYHGVANAVAETCWLCNLLRELHTPLSFATLVYCDNVSFRVRSEISTPTCGIQSANLFLLVRGMWWKLRMIRWTSGKTMLNMILNGDFRVKLEVKMIIHKMRERRLRWFGHVKKRPQTSPVRRVEAMLVDSLRRRARPKLMWEDKL
ncbi:putative cytochrome P450 [Tanacetum coccineum]